MKSRLPGQGPRAQADSDSMDEKHSSDLGWRS
jgi:hypothetical protein